MTLRGRKPASIRASWYHKNNILKTFETLGGSLRVDPDTRLEDVKLEHTTAYLARRLEAGASRHTIAKELRTLVQAVRRAARLGVFVPRVDPKHLIPEELGKVYTPRSRWLTPEEYAALYSALGDAHEQGKRVLQDRRDYLAFYCDTGVREAELYSIRREHYNAARGELFIAGTKTEKAERTLPLTAQAKGILERRLREVGDAPFPEWHTIWRDLHRACERVRAQWNPEYRALANKDRRDIIRHMQRGVTELFALAAAANLRPRSVGHHLRELATVGVVRPVPGAGGVFELDEAALKRAIIAVGSFDEPRPARQFPPVSANDLRRTFCSRMLQAGVPERVCADFLGHVDSEMVRQVYGHLDTATMAAAIVRMEAARAVSGAVSKQASESSALPQQASGALTEKPNDSE